MFGLTTLMESVSDLENRDMDFDPIFEASVDLVDDDIKEQFIEDSVEDDMAGNGITAEDEKKFEKILRQIPEYDKGMDKNIKALTESLGFSVPDEY